MQTLCTFACICASFTASKLLSLLSLCTGASSPEVPVKVKRIVPVALHPTQPSALKTMQPEACNVASSAQPWSGVLYIESSTVAAAKTEPQAIAC